eukprot:169843-Prorocentrum_minimum.AAC.1
MAPSSTTDIITQGLITNLEEQCENYKEQCENYKEQCQNYKEKCELYASRCKDYEKQAKLYETMIEKMERHNEEMNEMRDKHIADLLSRIEFLENSTIGNNDVSTNEESDIDI